MVNIRPERVRDEAVVRAVLLEAFPTDAEARLVAALHAAGRLTVSLVVERAGRALVAIRRWRWHVVRR